MCRVKDVLRLLGVLLLTLLFRGTLFADYHAASGLACGLTGPQSNSCPGFTTCGGDGRAGICGCAPRTSFTTGACGVYHDNCGGYVDLGGCSNGQICGGDRTCQSVAPAENVTCGATLQSNKNYKFTGGSSSGTCFSFPGSLSNIVMDGDGKTLTSATGFFFSNGAHNITIKNFVIDTSSAGVSVGSNVYPDPTNCNALPRDIRIQGNRFVKGSIDMAVTTAYGCNFTIEGNRFEQGGIHLSHYVMKSGVGNHVLVDNVIEQQPNIATALSISKIDNLLVLHNSIKHLSNIDDVMHASIVENRFHVNGAIGGQDNNGVAMLHMAKVGKSFFAGNYVFNQESTSPSDYRMAINTYTSQNTEYLWNTIIQQLPNPRGSSEQMAINFRSGGNDNYIYRNYLRSYYESGYALKTLLATSPGQCMIDLETGAMGSCELYRNVIDSNVIIGSARALYLTDSHDFTIRNNVLVGGASAAAPCGSTDNFTHNLLDGGTGLNCTPGANVNNIIYSSSQSSWFKNRSNYDFHLMPGAGAIDQVNPNALATIDMAGISRPFGPKADSGPYEMINDSQLPTAPNGLNATALSWSRIRLNWAPSTDNDAISHYNVYTYSAGSFIFFKSVPFTRFYDVGLPPNTLSRYKVSSVDRAGNESALSAEFSTTTSSGPVALVDTLAPGTPSQLTVN